LDNQASILAFHRGQVAGTPPTYSGSISDIIDLMIGDDSPDSGSSGRKNKRGCVMGITSGSGPALWLALLGAGLWIARRKRKGSI
jgi:MYXO-CTERM domain-containing protein